MHRNKLLPIFAAVALIASSGVSQSAVLITATESGGDVVFDAAGTINTAAWTAGGAGFITLNVEPVTASLILGTAGPDVFGSFFDPINISSPSSFGPGLDTDASSGSGDVFGMRFLAIDTTALFLPQGYVSGNPLAATMTFDNATFASLGMQTGTYVWSWGNGADADSMTLNVVPEPSSVVLLVFGCLGVSMIRRRRR